MSRVDKLTKADLEKIWNQPGVHNYSHLNAWGANREDRGRACIPHEGKQVKARVAKLRKRLWDVYIQTTTDARGLPHTVYKARRA